MRGGSISGLADTRAALLTAMILFVDGGPGAALSFLFGNATLFVAFLNVLGLALLLVRITGFVAARHGDLRLSGGGAGAIALHWREALLRPDVIVLVDFSLPVPVGPGIVAERWRVLELPFGDPGDIPVELGVVFQGTPGDWVVAMAETKEPAKAHDCEGDTAGNLVDHQVIDFTDLGAIHIIDIGSLDIFARDKLMVGMDGAGCHGCSFRC